jgi:hypothetical protein
MLTSVKARRGKNKVGPAVDEDILPIRKSHEISTDWAHINRDFLSVDNGIVTNCTRCKRKRLAPISVSIPPPAGETNTHTRARAKNNVSGQPAAGPNLNPGPINTTPSSNH